jgi:hypothetical protein
MSRSIILTEFLHHGLYPDKGSARGVSYEEIPFGTTNAIAYKLAQCRSLRWSSFAGASILFVGLCSTSKAASLSSDSFSALASHCTHSVAEQIMLAVARTV